MSEQPEGYLPTGVSHATLNPAFVGEGSVQAPEPFTESDLSDQTGGIPDDTDAPPVPLEALGDVEQGEPVIETPGDEDEEPQPND